MSTYKHILFWAIFTSTFHSSARVDPMDWERIRSAYPVAVENKALCAVMIEELSEQQGLSMTEPSLQIAYRGGFQTIWANHVFNPVAKLRTFNQGKSNIEKAVLMDPNSPEIRYIRLSVQQHAPGFLGYKDAIAEDVEFLRKHRGRITSEVVQQHITRLLGGEV